MTQIWMYTDGACSGNPGPGGWGTILRCTAPAGEKELSGAARDTTNNRMELTAVLEGFRHLTRSCHVTVCTDSRYISDAFCKHWIDKWQTNGWRTASKKPVKNDDLWKELLTLMQPHTVAWEWVRGHDGHPENERADALAVSARERLAAGV